jgi:hypothetical protein
MFGLVTSRLESVQTFLTRAKILESPQKKAYMKEGSTTIMEIFDDSKAKSRHLTGDEAIYVSEILVTLTRGGWL